MKKLICLSLVLVALFCSLTSCGFFENLTESLQENSKSVEKIDAMLLALAEGRTDDAMAMIHPDKTEDYSVAIAQMIGYLGGRRVSEKSLTNINVRTSTGTGGNVTEEQLGYQLTLDDGSIIYVHSVYLSDSSGEGFITFQLMIGVA